MSPDSPAKPKSSASFSTFLAVALLSAAVLGFEIALSRVFATILRYQFAFLVVSLALCGLGLGGLWAHVRPRTSLENAALGWGVAVLVSLALILRGVFAFVPQHYWLAALLVLVPFSFAGAFLSLAFGKFKDEGGRLYAYDLAGAALAAAGCVALMQSVGAINACLAFASLGAFAGVLCSPKRAFPLVICALLALCLPLNMARGLWSVQPIPPNFDKDGFSLANRGVTQDLFTELGALPAKKREFERLKQQRKIDTNAVFQGTQIVDTRWNAFARTDVVLDPDAGDNSFLIYTNGNVPTNMIRWNGQAWQLPSLVSEFPLSDWTFEAANLKDRDVFSIGPGGGLDALLALRYEAKRFDGAEINPSIVGLMNENAPISFRGPDGKAQTIKGGYREWNGGIYRDPRVRVRTADGRDAVREAKGRYRLVFSALTKTATAGQGAALLESFIYTREAFGDYLNAVDDQGMMAIVGDSDLLMARLTATAVDHFTRQGRTEREAGSHIALVYADPRIVGGPYRWALVVKKTPFSSQQSAGMAKGVAARKLFPLWIPGQASSDELFSFGSLLSGALSLDAFIASGLKTSPRQPVPLDFSPCPDDRPFVLDLSTSAWSLFESSPSLSLMLGLSLASTLGLAGFLSLGRNERGKRDGRAPLLFLLLGVGFMIVEIPLIQKLVLPLGYPTLSLSVILFSILLGGGAGALYSQRLKGNTLRVHALLCALLVATIAMTFGIYSDVVSHWLLDLPIIVRCLTVAVALLPLGFCMGTPFPSGLRLIARGERGVALAWALNGTASVLGSIGAAILAKQIGFSLVLTLGALVYVLVAGVFGLKSAGTETE